MHLQSAFFNVRLTSSKPAATLCIRAACGPYIAWLLGAATFAAEPRYRAALGGPVPGGQASGPPGTGLHLTSKRKRRKWIQWALICGKICVVLIRETR